MRQMFFISALFLTAVIYSFGCGSSSSTMPGQVEVNIEGLNGDGDVPTNCALIYQFDDSVDEETVDTDSFYLATGDTCDPDHRVSASVDCTSSTVCVLVPEYLLSEGTEYTVCLTQDIQFLDGTPFDGDSATFATEGGLAVSSVTKSNDGADTELSTEERLTGVTEDGFTVTFSRKIDESTLQNEAGGITLSCADSNQALTIDASSDTSINISYDLPLPGYADCTLTFGTDIKDIYGNALVTNTSYTFKTMCATSDSFVTDTLGFVADATEGNCWEYSTVNVDENYSTSFAFDDGVMRYTAPDADIFGSGDRAHSIYKEFDADDLIVVSEFKAYGDDGDMERDYCSLFIVPGTEEFESFVVAFFALSDDETVCELISWVSGEDIETSKESCDIPTNNDPLYFKIVKDGTSFDLSYGPSPDDFSDPVTFENSGFEEIGSYTVGISCNSITEGWTQDIGYIEIDGADPISPGDQY